MSVKKYVRWHAMVSFTDWEMDGNARFTGPNGMTFADASTPNDTPSIVGVPATFVGPATFPSANKGKFISSFSTLVIDVLALLNSSIVKAVFALGNVKTAQSVVMNGIEISEKAIAG